MKRHRLLLLPLLAACLTGCCPSGCFVLHGAAYEALARPTPHGDQWSKDGVSPEQRRAQWVSCGGYKSGNFAPRREDITALQTKENLTSSQAYSRLFKDAQRCMRDNGYRYTGKCYDNEISRSLPACGAP